MYTLRENFSSPNRFLIGVELVTARGTMADHQAVHAGTFATELAGKILNDE